MTQPRKEPGANRNIRRLKTVLTALAAGGETGLRVADVTEAVDLNRSAVNRILTGLAAHDLAERVEETGRYRLGSKLIGWVCDAGDHHRVSSLAAPAIARLALWTEDTVYLTVRFGEQAVCVDRVEGSYPIRTLTLNVGDRRPLGFGAGSLALLAFLPQDRIEPAIERHASACAVLGLEEAALRSMVARSQALGYALNDSRIIPGMTAVGVPILRDGKTPIAALSVAAVNARMGVARRHEIVERLRSEVTAIEGELAGGRLEPSKE